ncbi:MAG: excinuclease ABC subunit UvrA [Candidatus Odinarchaeota archaeon]
MRKAISVKGARANNLKNVDVEIPRDKLTVITGVSGSGKSSLVYDVIFGEAQRKFLESMSSYSRSRVPMVDKADVDSVRGLSPVVAIRQRGGVENPRSTVGTITEISNYLRLLYSTVGRAHCPYCLEEIPTKSTGQIAERVQSLPDGTVIQILAPTYKIYGEDYEYMLEDIRSRGYRRIRIDGQDHKHTDGIELDESRVYRFEVIIDKFVIKRNIYKQLVRAIENAVAMGYGFLQVEILNEKQDDNGKIKEFYEDMGCSEHHMVMNEQLPYHFSFNNPAGSCYYCNGLGTVLKAEKSLIIVNEEKSINQGAIDFNWAPFNSLANHYGFSLDTPIKDLPPEIMDIIFYGTRGEKIEMIPDKRFKAAYYNRRIGQKMPFLGIINVIDRWYRRSRQTGRINVESYDYWKRRMAEKVCPACNGKKLRRQKLLVHVNGKNIHELGELSLNKLEKFLDEIKAPEGKEHVMGPINAEIKTRLDLLVEIGLGYLNINRRSETLSGGEEQRIRLSTQIGSELMGMLYVLDEPSIGLHQKDCSKVINALKRIRDLGNTVIVVEHDLETINQADHIIEMGPGPGIHGGTVHAEGKLSSVISDPDFLTGKYLTGKKKINLPARRRKANGQSIKIKGARQNNLKNIDVDIPLGVFICVTGVSGSGKSSLINDILYKRIYSVLRDPRVTSGEHDDVEGVDNLSEIRNVDQSPIGRHSRSNPATYIGVYDKIRKLFADVPEARERGYTASHFSFNSTDGRCPECEGYGEKSTQLQFMPDVRILCPICKGARYSREILEIRYRGRTIADVFNLSVEEALDFFKDVRLIKHKLSVMSELGLGYLKLGQSSTTLSGGEAQRVKLAKELGKMKKTTHNLYILDEPTTGLHMEDIQKLLDCLNRLVDSGNTVLVIEHQLDVIKTADWIIDLGPEGGEDEGGHVVGTGTPEDLANVERSYTGQYLKKMLTNGGNMF